MNCTLLCVLLKYSRRIIVCEKSPEWIRFVREYYSDALVTEPEVCRDFALHHSDRGRANAALEAAGAVDTLRLPWECVRPKVVVTAVAFCRPAADTAFSGYVWQEPHLLYRRHGWLRLRPIGQGKIDTMPLITHRFPLSRIGEAYRLFESRQDGAFYCKRGYKFVPPFAVKINSIDFVSDGPRPRVAPPAYPSGKEISSFSQYYFADWSASSSEIPSASATPRP